MPQPKKGILDAIAKTAAKGAAKKAAKKAENAYVKSERKKAGATLKELGKGMKEKAKAEKSYIKSERKKAGATLKAMGKNKNRPNAVDRSGQNVKVVAGVDTPWSHPSLTRIMTDEANRGTVRVYRKTDAKVEKRALKAANKKKKGR